MEPTRARITKSLLNELLLSGALEYLENCPGVSIEANSNPPAIPIMIRNWESQNLNQLPQDLKDFLSVSDGINVCWYVSSSFGIQPKSKSWTREQLTDAVKIGNIFINSLHDIVPLSDIDSDKNLFVNAFEIQDILPFGKVCLVYSKEIDQSPEINIQLFLNGTWTFLAPDFSSYFRLQVQYLGIRGWQMSRTRDGMPQECNQPESTQPNKNTDVSIDKIQKLISIMSSREEKSF